MFVVHRLTEKSRGAFLSHLCALPHDDRRLRFGTPLGSDGIATYVERIRFDEDAVFAVKNSLIAKYTKVTDQAEAKRLGMPSPFVKLEWDFKLAPESGVKARQKIAPSDAIA